jgi:hypothetical protein
MNVPAYQIYLMGPSAGPSTDDLCKKNILEAHCKSSCSRPSPSIDHQHFAAAALNTNQEGLTVSLLLGCIVLPHGLRFKEFWR